jgi:serine/threonine-protein kinase RsbW
MEHWFGTSGTGPRRVTRAHFELGPSDAADEGRRMAWVDALEELTVLIATAGGLSCDRACDFGLAVREGLVNALKHGTEASRRVVVAFRLLGGPTLEVTVRDGGPGFDPGAVPDPRSPENLARGCGRGVFYMRQFADEVTFSFPRRGGTVTRLRKRLPERGPVADPGLTEWMGPFPGQRPHPIAGGGSAF